MIHYKYSNLAASYVLDLIHVSLSLWERVGERACVAAAPPTRLPIPYPKAKEEITLVLRFIRFQSLFSGGREMLRDFPYHVLNIIENLFIREPQYAEALRYHVRIAVLIVMPLLIWLMRRSIALNGRLRVVTIKVRDVIAKLMLSSEFEPE
jgi:hypothetical protein